MAFPKPTLHPLNTVDESLIKYAVLVTRYQGKWVFCRHKNRSAWELPGGHRESGESPMETARRELYEETGAVSADIEPVGIYKLFDYGLLCFAEIIELKEIPSSSEIAEIQLCDDLPDDLTYAGVHNCLFAWVQDWQINRILSQMGITTENIRLEQLRNEEDGSLYDVWKVSLPEKSYILKKAKGNESEIYRAYLHQDSAFAPKLYAVVNVDGDNWLLLEYIPGNNLMRCSREKLRATLDSLIDMQSRFWQADDVLCSFDKAQKGRVNRCEYLNDPLLESTYTAYLQAFSKLPRTLCHDDLLPFNVIVNDGKAVFIDWEVAGILPYPTSLARLIAHATEDNDAFFFMKEADKQFAIDYYFDNFIKGRGVPYISYRRHLDFCLLYEYCEWVYLGNRYPDADQLRFQSYCQKARSLAEQILK